MACEYVRARVRAVIGPCQGEWSELSTDMEARVRGCPKPFPLSGKTLGNKAILKWTPLKMGK